MIQQKTSVLLILYEKCFYIFEQNSDEMLFLRATHDGTQNLWINKIGISCKKFFDIIYFCEISDEGIIVLILFLEV